MSFLAEDAFLNVHKQEVFDFDLKDDFRLDSIVSNGKQFDLHRFWDSDEHEDDLDEEEEDVKCYSDLTNGTSNVFASSTKNKKEDFHKMLNDWQDHLSSMKTFDEDHPDSSEILTGLRNSVIDELLPEHSSLPIKIEKDQCSENQESGSSQIACVKIEEKEDTSKSIKRNSVSALEAEDAKSLLEQFEASEMICSNIKVENDDKLLQHQNIRDSLPKEVVQRIKASSGGKKSIAIIPAISSKTPGRAATRLQDAAAALGRNKLLKIVAGGESVQLDHDYCNGTGSESSVLPPQNFYHSSVADYGPATYSRLPEYYMALAPQKVLQPKSIKDWPEKNSKKDSGLESGDVSDASEEVIPQALIKNVTMVSVLKRSHLPQATTNTIKVESIKVEPEEKEIVVATISEPVPRKRKLNLDEYRSRREEREKVDSIQNKNKCSSVSVSVDSASIAQNSGTSVNAEASNPAIKIEVKSVEVQATLEDIISATSTTAVESVSKSRHKKSSIDSSRRRREYRSRRVSSSSSSSADSRSSRHRSHRRRKNSRSDRRSSRSRSRARSTRSRSRSRSSSVNSTCSTCSSNSLSSSRNRSHSHSTSRRYGSSKHQSLWKTKDRFSRNIKHHDQWRRHTQSSRSSNRTRDSSKHDERDQVEKLRQVEERRVIYVGRVEEGTTKADLRERFEVFGPIVDISVHFRDHGDNYGFVTFAYKVDAYEAVEHGNDDPTLPQYDLSFGGRRAFCKQRYADLDVERNNRAYNGGLLYRSNDSFDNLLREAQAKLRKRTSV